MRYTIKLAPTVLALTILLAGMTRPLSWPRRTSEARSRPRIHRCRSSTVLPTRGAARTNTACGHAAAAALHRRLQRQNREVEMDTIVRTDREHMQTIVVGGGQAGLAVGYHLARRGLPFVILDANEHVGDAWRNRWDSLRLFTPAAYDSLPGMRFPAPANDFPTKDEMADYLEDYARRFDLPVGRAPGLNASRRKRRFVLTAIGGERFEAENVVVAMANYQQPQYPRSPRARPRTSFSCTRPTTVVLPSSRTGRSFS